MGAATQTRKRRAPAKKDAGPALSVVPDARQPSLPFVPPAPVTAALYLPDRWLDLDLCVGGAALPSSLPLALAKGARVLRTVSVVGTPSPPSPPGDARADALVQKAGGPVMELGMQTAALREYFIGATDVGVAGVLRLTLKDSAWSAGLSKNLLPYVLSSPAVKAGEMPPPGVSALPKSLEAAVPARLRYWEAPSPEAAKAARDALVDAGLFEDRLLKLVDGQIRLCVEQLYLYEPDADASPAAKYDAKEGDNSLAEIVAGLLPDGKKPVSPFSLEGATSKRDDGAWAAALATEARDASNVLVLSPPFSPVKPVIDALAKAAPAAAWIVEFDVAHDPDAAKEMARVGPVYKVAGLPGRLFVSSFLPSGPVTWVEPPPPPEAAEVVAGTVVKRLAHIEKAGAEERYVLGIVLEPETVDAQNDIYSADEIVKSAHVWMEKFRTVGLMHKGAINDKVKVLESYLAPVDFEVDAVVVKKGTWLMAVRVLDDALWDAVKKGDLTGFSIGGSAVRKPDPGGGVPQTTN